MKALYTISIILLLFSALANASAKQTSLIMSRKCDAKKIRDLAGAALVSLVEKRKDSRKGYVFEVTLNTDKLEFPQLMKKMFETGCF